MKVFNNLLDLPKFRNAVMTIGSFDGVHHGHQKILERVNQLADSCDGESIVITFHPHPRLLLYPDDPSLRLLNTIDEKVALLEKYGIDNVVVVPFTKEFAQQNPDSYIQNFLIEKFNPKYIVIGYDHRFGKNRIGNIDYLRRYEDIANFKIVDIEKQEVEDIAVSSTKIRKALELGDIKTATHLLGHAYTLLAERSFVEKASEKHSDIQLQILKSNQNTNSFLNPESTPSKQFWAINHTML